MRKLNSKGFSLVELVIVIAIMAVLVGALAPQYLKYVEKARISSDKELLQAFNKTLTYAYMDPEIVKDADSQALINSWGAVFKLEDLMSKPNSGLTQEVLDTMGIPDCNQATYESLLKSKHKPNATIYVAYFPRLKNPFTMWITTTDYTGAGDLSNTTNDPDQIGTCINIQ